MSYKSQSALQKIILNGFLWELLPNPKVLTSWNLWGFQHSVGSHFCVVEDWSGDFIKI